MAKKLSDFTVRVNLHGWNIRGVVTCSQGQEFDGAQIHKRMVQSIEDGETFKLKGVVTPVCVLKGGKLEDLKAAMAAAVDEPAPKPEKKVEEPKEPAPAPKPEPPADEPKEQPKRKPKPRTSGD